MDKLMFWKKKKKPVEGMAQALANLMGTSVAGFIPEPPHDQVDIESELLRHNVAIASLVILAGLIKGDPNQQALILSSIQPAHLGDKSFEQYLFTLIAETVRQNQNISREMIERRIPEFSQVIYGEPANKRTMEGDFFKWSQIQSFEPTSAQLAHAIELCQKRVKRNPTG